VSRRWTSFKRLEPNAVDWAYSLWCRKMWSEFAWLKGVPVPFNGSHFNALLFLPEYMTEDGVKKLSNDFDTWLEEK
jgi:hypothetical protein